MKLGAWVSLAALFTMALTACGEDKAVLEAEEKQFVYRSVDAVFSNAEALVHKRAYLGCDEEKGRTCRYCDIKVEFDPDSGMFADAAIVAVKSAKKGYLHKTEEIEFDFGEAKQSFSLIRVSTPAADEMIESAEAWCKAKGAGSFLTAKYDGEGLRAAND